MSTLHCLIDSFSLANIVTSRLLLEVFKMHLIRKDFSSLINNVSFSSSTNVGSRINSHMITMDNDI